MLTQTKVQQAPDLKACVEQLSEKEIRSAIAYIMAISGGQTIVIQESSPRLMEMILLVEMMNPRTRDKLSLFLVQKVAPKRPSKYRIRER